VSFHISIISKLIDSGGSHNSRTCYKGLNENTMNMNSLLQENQAFRRKFNKKEACLKSKRGQHKRLLCLPQMDQNGLHHLRNKFDQSVRSSSSAATEIFKFVSFAENASVRRTLPRNSYTNEESYACWYNEVEFARMTKANVALVAMLDSGSSSVHKYCTRGLEKLTRTSSSYCHKNRNDSIQAVLDEQKRLRDAGLSGDDEAISRVYTAITSSSRLWAQIVGLRDRREAEKYL
jgi:hypothetical protein